MKPPARRCWCRISLTVKLPPAPPLPFNANSQVKAICVEARRDGVMESSLTPPLGVQFARETQKKGLIRLPFHADLIPLTGQTIKAT